MASRQLKRSVIKGAVISLISHNRENYEVKVLGGPLDGESESYSSYIDALFAFEKIVTRAVLEGGKG